MRWMETKTPHDQQGETCTQKPTTYRRSGSKSMILKPSWLKDLNWDASVDDVPAGAKRHTVEEQKSTQTWWEESWQIELVDVSQPLYLLHKIIYWPNGLNKEYESRRRYFQPPELTVTNRSVCRRNLYSSCFEIWLQGASTWRWRWSTEM